MFIKVENGDAINLDEVTSVTFHERGKVANLYSCGVLIAADSAVAYDYFRNEGLYVKVPVREESVQAG